MAKKGILIEEHSVADLFDKLDEIIAHQKHTNGNVRDNSIAIQKICSNSIGLWISHHPFKFTAGTLAVISVLISDIRHPLFALITSLFI